MSTVNPSMVMFLIRHRDKFHTMGASVVQIGALLMNVCDTCAPGYQYGQNALNFVQIACFWNNISMMFPVT